MYFSIVLVLLLTFEFIQMQMNPPPIEYDPSHILLQTDPPESSNQLPTEDLIPFGCTYTDETIKFLKEVTKDIKIFPLEKLKMNLEALWKAMKDDDSSNEYRCITNKLPNFPFIELEEDQCTPYCHATNPTYVQFLNNHIREVQKFHFLDADISILKLYAVPSDISNMCVDANEDEYLCLCRVNYEIRVSKTFYLAFKDIVQEKLTRDPKRPRTRADVNSDVYREQFAALAILLKFQPRSAFFYLCYLLYRKKNTRR